jgi:hypothetical protein
MGRVNEATHRTRTNREDVAHQPMTKFITIACSTVALAAGMPVPADTCCDSYYAVDVTGGDQILLGSRPPAMGRIARVGVSAGKPLFQISLPDCGPEASCQGRNLTLSWNDQVPRKNWQMHVVTHTSAPLLWGVRQHADLLDSADQACPTVATPGSLSDQLDSFVSPDGSMRWVLVPTCAPSFAGCFKGGKWTGKESLFETKSFNDRCSIGGMHVCYDYSACSSSCQDKSVQCKNNRMPLEVEA